MLKPLSVSKLATFLAIESLVFGVFGWWVCSLNGISENTPDHQHSVCCRTIGAGPSSIVWWSLMVAPPLLLVLSRVLSAERNTLVVTTALIAVGAPVLYVALLAT